VTRPRRRLAVAFGAAALVANASWSAPAVGASFTTSATTSVQTAATATLAPVQDPTASRDPQGAAAVSWTEPVRADVAPEYHLERTVDGITTTIAPAVTTEDGTASFTDDLTVPGAVLDKKTVTDVSVGGTRACAIAAGAAYCWGAGITEPAAVGGLLSGKTVTDISVGLDDHVCAVADGAAYCWGSNVRGQLGDGTTTDSTVPVAVDVTGGLAGKTVTEVSAGSLFTCAIADDAAYCWGDSTYGKLGIGSTTGASPVPLAVSAAGVLDGATVTQISAGSWDACVIADGAVYCWGYNVYGEIGINNYTVRPVPTAPITTGVLSGKTLTQVTAGDFSTCVLDSDGAAYCWGKNDTAQLGDGTTTNRYVPVSVSTDGALAGKTLARIDTGGGSTCAVDTEGTAYCWGKNDTGQLGDGTATMSKVAVAVDTSGLPGGAAVTRIASGQSTACTVADSAAYCWGLGSSGQLGTSTTDDSTVPVAARGALLTYTCDAGWLLTTAATRCAPGAGIAVRYQVDYAKAGWSPAAPATVDAGLTDGD